MNCLIVEDKEIFRVVMRRLIELDHTLVLVGECKNAIDAHQTIKNLNTSIDLIFLDIFMPGISGLELAKILEGKSPLIIFTTSLAEHAAEAFDLNVVDFLLKPISPVRFLKAIEKAKKIFQKNEITVEEKTPEFIFIRDSNVIRRLKINDILYFEATGDYVKIRLVNQHYSIHSSLKIIQQKLPQHLFLRVHRSFIVNLSKIDSAEGKTLILNKHLIPVSDAYKANLNRYMQFL